MAQLGFTEITVLNPDGSPASGVTLTVRFQGAQIRGNIGASPYTVDDVGATSTNATVAIYAFSTKVETSGATATVNSGTSIGTAPNLGAASDDDRLTITSPTPTLYEDANGGTSISNILTTNTQGRAQFYAEAGFYDIKQTGGGLTDELHTDVPCTGPKGTAYVFDSGTAVGYSDNIVSAATGSTVGTAGAIIREFKNAGTRKASIDKDGDFTGTDGHFANIDTSATAAVGTNLTVGGTANITGATTLAALTASGLITGNAGLTISAGAVSLPAASLAVAALASGITSVTSAIQTTAMALSTTPTTITNCSISPTIAATSSTVILIGKVQYDSVSASARTATITLYDGASPVSPSVSGTCAMGSTTLVLGGAVALAIITGVSGSKTYTLKASQNAGTDVNATAGQAMIIAIELKK